MLSLPVHRGDPSLDLLQPARCDHHHCLFTRKGQYHGRGVEQKVHLPARVRYIQTSYIPSSPGGWTPVPPFHRSFCHTVQHKTCVVLFTSRNRPTLNRRHRLLQLERESTLCIPSHSINNESIGEDAPRRGNGNSNSSILALPGLVSLAVSTVFSSPVPSSGLSRSSVTRSLPNTAPATTPPRPSCLAASWFKQTEMNCSQDVKNVLLNSR